MFRRLAASTALILSALAASPALAQDTDAPAMQELEGIVALVNDEMISFSDVRQRARLLLLSLGGAQPTQEQVQQITAQALEQLIDEKLQLQEAAEFEVEISDTEIANNIERIAQQSGLTREGLLNSLLQSGINPTSLEEQTRADIAWRRIMGGLYGSRIRVSDNQVEERLERLKAASEKEQYQVSEIFLYAPLEADKTQALEAANSLLEQMQAGAPFRIAAQRFSSAPTAATGGDMGWITLDDLDETRQEALKAMPETGLTPPIIADDGIYIMLVRDKRSPQESTTIMDVTRITVVDADEAALQAAIDQIENCSGVDAVVSADDNLNSAVLQDLDVNQLGPEGREMLLSTPEGDQTDIFAQSGTLAVMYVCDRRDTSDALPSRQQVADSLYNRELGMISERSLRDLRREATIIRR